MWYLVCGVFLAIWVLVDGLKRKANAILWALGTVFLGPIVLPLYLAKRPLQPGELREGGTTWNVLKNFAVSWTIFMAVAAVWGMVAVSEHTSTLQGEAEKAGAAIGTAIGLGMIGALWFFPCIAAVVIAFLSKKSSLVERGSAVPLEISSKVVDEGAEERILQGKQVMEKPKRSTRSWERILGLNWIFGVLFFLAGLGSVSESALAALCLICISLLLLPPVRNFTYSKTKKKLPAKARAITIFVLFIAFGIFTDQSEDRKARELAEQRAQAQAEKAAIERQKNIDYFSANRAEILGTVKQAIESKDYQSAISQSERYLVSGDQELADFNKLAKSQLLEIQKAEKTKELLAYLQSLPSSEYGGKRRLYQQLVTLHPENEEYRSKVHFYTEKIVKIAEIEKAEKTESLLAYLKSLPSSEYERKRRLYQQLTTLHPENEEYRSKVRFYTEKVNQEGRRERIGSEFSAWHGSHWFEGGNLHSATIAEWKAATYHNKLATAGDCLAATKWRGYLKSPDDFDRIRVKAQMLVSAVDGAVPAELWDSVRVNDIAAAIIVMSNDLGP
jgi:uncharacterized protein (UPF0297 family)